MDIAGRRNTTSGGFVVNGHLFFVSLIAGRRTYYPP